MDLGHDWNLGLDWEFKLRLANSIILCVHTIAKMVNLQNAFITKINSINSTDFMVPQVVPFTECKMGMQPQEYTTSVLEPKLFVEKTCNQVNIIMKFLIEFKSFYSILIFYTLTFLCRAGR